MSESAWVRCEHCEGEGRVIDYDAIDISIGDPYPPPTTKTVECPFCLGKGEVRATTRLEEVHDE